MSVFKEEIHVIEKFAGRQKQIYSDSCDYGVFLTDAEKAELREAVQELRRHCHTKKVERTEGMTGVGTKTEVFVGWEYVEEECVRGTLVTIDTWTPKLPGPVFSEHKTLFQIQMESKVITFNSLEKWSDS